MPDLPPTPPDRYSPDAPPQLVNRARAYVAVAPWRYAKTMDRIPHWYSMRKIATARKLGPGHEALFELCRDYGYVRRWYRREFGSIDLGGWSIWHLGTGDFLNTAPLGVAFEPAPTCHVHRDESMWLDPGEPYDQWRCALCSARAVSPYPRRS